MIVHYQNSLTRPQVSVLRHLQATPELDKSRRALVIQGDNSLVAKVRRENGQVLAVRVIEGEPNPPTWPDLYPALRRLASTSLHGVIPANQEVIANAIEIQGRSHSALVQDWIEGPTLAAAISRARRAGNAGVLRALAKAVLDFANALRGASFAHQNLNADNLIISPTGRLVAVGLDAAIWPGSPPSATPHRTPAFLHPKGAGSGYEQDAFATLLIYSTLRAMADDPALAATYGDPIGTPGGALLFSPWDLADPARSRAFGEIAANVRPDTRELIDALRRACTEPASEIERWIAAIPGIAPSAIPSRQAPAQQAPAADTWDVADAIERIRTRFQGDESTEPAPETAPSPASWDSWGVRSTPTRRAEPVPPQRQPRSTPAPAPNDRDRSVQPTQPRREEVVVDHQTDGWTTVAPAAIVDGAVVPVATMSTEPVNGPAAPAIPERRQHRRPQLVEVPLEPWERLAPAIVLTTPTSLIEDRRALREAIARRDANLAFSLWERLADDAVGRTFALEVDRLRSMQVRGRIREAASRKDDREVIRLAESARIDGATLDGETRAMVKAARDRIEVSERLASALAGSDRDRLADLAVTGELMALGETDRGSLRKVLRALDWPILQRALDSEDDQIILSAYDPALFETGGDLTETVRARIELARVRVEWRQAVRAALKKRDVGALESLFTSPPPQALDRLSASERKRSRRLIEQQRALAVLKAAVDALDDSSIVSALNHVERVGARITDRATWTAIQGVVEKASLVEDILEAARATPFDVGRLAQLIPAAKSVGLDRDPRLVGEFALDRLESELLRQAHLRRIRAAIHLDDDAAIVLAAVPDPYGVLDDLEEGDRDRVAAAILARRKVDRESVANRFERGQHAAFT